MHLKDTTSKSACMKISLEPSDKDDTCSIAITFGEKSVSVPVMVKAKKE
jgi:hypothetical protein